MHKLGECARRSWPEQYPGQIDTLIHGRRLMLLNHAAQDPVWGRSALRSVEVHPGACLALRGAPVAQIRRMRTDELARRELLRWLEGQGLLGIAALAVAYKYVFDAGWVQAIVIGGVGGIIALLLFVLLMVTVLRPLGL